jgi:hypothetical protein
LKYGKSVERLLARIRREIPDAPEPLVFDRIYAGYWQRASGAWSWAVTSPTWASWSVGSQWPVKDVLRWTRWDVTVHDWGEISIDPPGSGEATWTTTTGK